MAARARQVVDLARLSLRQPPRSPDGRPVSRARSVAVGADGASVAPGAIAMPAAFDELAAPPTFVTGYARSGTTWTLELFDRHPEVCAIFETWLLTYRSGITGVFRQPQWHPDFYAAQREKVDMPHATVQLLPYEEMVRELGDLAARWLMRAVRPGQRFLVEKGPLDMAAVATMFPEARFVHVIRDGRDASLSARAAANSWDPGMDREMGIAARATDWRDGVLEIQEHGRKLGDRYLEVHFEAMRRNFDSEARRLFEFAQVPLDASTLEQIRERTKLSSYDPRQRASGFRGQGRAGGWRDKFTPVEAFEFDRAAGDLLVELGYEDSRRWWRSFARAGLRARRGAAA